MLTLEKTIVLLNNMSENQIETIYNFVQFLSSQQTMEKSDDIESIESVPPLWTDIFFLYRAW